MAPSPVGGAERVVLDLTEELSRQGVEVHLLPVLEPECEDHAFLAQVSPEITVHPILVPPRRYAMEREEVGAVLRRVDPAVVHTHGYRADVVDAAVARRTGLPTVSTVHGFTGGGVRNRLYEWAQRRALRRFEAVVAVSRSLAGELESNGISPARLHTIPNARARPRDLLGRQEARSQFGVSDEAFHVGWIGRVSGEKGPDTMLASLRHLQSEGRIPELRATFIGDGRDRRALEAETERLGLADRVTWAGLVPDAARLLRAFDLVVLSSRTEGTPIVALEAMTVGVPLVATRVGGVPDLTGRKGARLVPPDNPVALAEAIRRVHLNPDDARDRARIAQDRIREIAAPQAWAARYINVYEGVLGGVEG
jgi:glycosyltransferase involved in cell wall biosynthesis